MDLSLPILHIVLNISTIERTKSTWQVDTHSVIPQTNIISKTEDLFLLHSTSTLRYPSASNSKGVVRHFFVYKSCDFQRYFIILWNTDVPAFSTNHGATLWSETQLSLPGALQWPAGRLENGHLRMCTERVLPSHGPVCTKDREGNEETRPAAEAVVGVERLDHGTPLHWNTLWCSTRLGSCCSASKIRW